MVARLSTRLAAAGSVLVGVAALSVQAQPGRAQGSASGTIALTGARVVDGTGAAPLEQAAVVIAGGRIEAVGPAAAVRIPAGATRIDMAGKTVVPGLINAHAHLDSGDRALPLYDQVIGQLRLYARYGVTTVVTLGDDGRESLRARDENDRGAPDRARLYVAGPILVPTTVQEARESVDRAADLRVDIIKIRLDGGAGDMTPDVYSALIDRAHTRGLRVASHLFYLRDAKGLVEAGVDVLAHSVRDQDVDAAFVAELKRRNVGYIPTLTRDLSVFVYETTPAFFSDPFFLRGGADYRRQMGPLMDPALQERTRQSQQAQAIKQALEQATRNLKRLSDGGVAVAMGTDSGAPTGRWQGYFEHVELEMMVKAGLTPGQALVAATGGAAKIMRLGEVGTIERGKRADLLVLDANPLADITSTRQIHSVWIGGRRLAPADPK